MKSPATKLTTVRIPLGLYDVISNDAKNEDLGFNTLLNRILRKHVEWDRPAQRIGMISMPRGAFSELVNSVDGSKLKQALPVIQESHRELVEIIGGDNYLRLLEKLCKYGGLGTLSVKNSGPETTINLRHGLGRRVSDLLTRVMKPFSKQFIKSTEQENSITIVTRTGKKSLTKNA